MDGWMDGGREGGREGWMEGGMEGGRDGRRDGRREGGMEGGREEGREGGGKEGRRYMYHYARNNVTINKECCLHAAEKKLRYTHTVQRLWWCYEVIMNIMDLQTSYLNGCGEDLLCC